MSRGLGEKDDNSGIEQMNRKKWTEKKNQQGWGGVIGGGVERGGTECLKFFLLPPRFPPPLFNSFVMSLLPWTGEEWNVMRLWWESLQVSVSLSLSYMLWGSAAQFPGSLFLLDLSGCFSRPPPSHHPSILHSASLHLAAHLKQVSWCICVWNLSLSL